MVCFILIPFDIFKTTFFRQTNLLEWDLNYTERNIFNTDLINVENSRKKSNDIISSSIYHEDHQQM